MCSEHNTYANYILQFTLFNDELICFHYVYVKTHVVLSLVEHYYKVCAYINIACESYPILFEWLNISDRIKYTIKPLNSELYKNI